MSAKKTFNRVLGQYAAVQLKSLDEETQERLATVLGRPDLTVRYSAIRDVIDIHTGYGLVRLDAKQPDNIKEVFINNQPYQIVTNGIDAIEHLVGDYDDVRLVVDEATGRMSRGREGRRVRTRRNQQPTDIATEDIQEIAYNDLSKAGLTYENIHRELGSILTNPLITANSIVADLRTNTVAEKDIPHFLVYESEYRNEIMARIYNYNVETEEIPYNFKTVYKDDDSFIGRLVSSLGHDEAQYDEQRGVLALQEHAMGKDVTRHITNLPRVDEKGVFHNGNVSYLPYHLGYFKEGSGTRVERLRVIDPVAQAIDAVRLQYDLTGSGDVRFTTLLDVTRNLPDFDNHPYGEEILDTLKKKVVLSPRYRASNSLLADYNKQADELGAVALTMLDDDARGIIDPLGTSNGSNLGMIFYLTQDAEIQADGSIEAGESEYSRVGEVMSNYAVHRDNFNRNQMSFNAFLTSLDVQERNVFIGEFAMWNAEDAIVLTNDLGEGYKTGDKMEDFHGNKSTISVVLSDLTEEEIKERHLEYAVQFAKDNPQVDVITSPASLASRLNMGIVYEGLEGEKQDVHLPDGSVVKDGCVSLMYMRLPQTAEHKSKDYSQEGTGRRYSTLLRYALSSKVGDLYKEGLLSQEVHDAHVDEAASVFARLGVSFKDESQLVQEGNVNLFVDAPTVSMDDFLHVTPAAIRLALMNQMDNGTSVNIDLGDASVQSRLTGDAVVDSEGRHVLPIRIPEGTTIPYRYTDLFTQLSRGNYQGIDRAYQRLADVDYGQLARKDNILKNIDTMTFKEGARTTVIVPDPSVKLGEVRSNIDDTHLIIHRDPAIQSGNAVTVANKGGARPNVLHINPLIAKQFDADFDGDTMGENATKNLALDATKKQEFINRSSVEEQANYYGTVFLGTDGAHFTALSKANNLPMDHISFDDGKSNAELVSAVETQMETILQSPKSYGAYPISFTNEQTVQKSLFALADDGVKGKRDEIQHRLVDGYTQEDNRALAKALIAKSEWTGLAGAVTNNLIAEMGEGNYDVARVAFDVTHSMTQAVLQMKKDAERLPEIDSRIKQIKGVMQGKYDVEESRQMLKQITDGLLPEKAVDIFVDKVSEQQEDKTVFGQGVINGNDVTTTKLSYISAQAFGKTLQALGTQAKSEGLER